MAFFSLRNHQPENDGFLTSLRHSWGQLQSWLNSREILKRVLPKNIEGDDTVQVLSMFTLSKFGHYAAKDALQISAQVSHFQPMV